MDDMGLYTQKQITNEPVIPLIDVIQSEEYNYHVYPYINANDLTQEKFDYNDFYKVFDIVKYLHQRKIVHLDIKPDNFLKKGSKLYITDFEFCRKVKHTQMNLKYKCGTPNFVAPEIMDYRICSLKSDIYSLGIMFYVMKTGDYSLKWKQSKLLSHEEKYLIHKMLDKNMTKRPSIEDCISHYKYYIMP